MNTFNNRSSRNITFSRKVIISIVIIIFIVSGYASAQGIPLPEINYTYETNEQIFLGFNGDILYVGGSGPGNYSSIQDAITDAKNGDTIFVYSGIYFENNITINKTIWLKGEDKENTIIDGNGNGNDIFFVIADYVKISGFTIQNTTDDLYGRGLNIAIVIVSNNNIIADNMFKNNGVPIGMFGSSNNEMIDNSFTNNVYGIYLGDSSNNQITNNIMTYNVAGIVLYNSSKNNIEDNTITNSQWFAIDVEESEENIIHNNQILKNDGFTLNLIRSDNNYITKNNIKDNNYNGINIAFSSCNNTITRNTIENNTFHGIFIGYWFQSPNSSKNNNNIISENNIINNNYGIKLEDSWNNEISMNNFQGNYEDAYFENCRNTWKRNYWNRPRLIPKPIFGRRLIGQMGLVFIPMVNFDLRPAKLPYDI